MAVECCAAPEAAREDTDSRVLGRVPDMLLDTVPDTILDKIPDRTLDRTLGRILGCVGCNGEGEIGNNRKGPGPDESRRHLGNLGGSCNGNRGDTNDLVAYWDNPRTEVARTGNLDCRTPVDGKEMGVARNWTQHVGLFLLQKPPCSGEDSKNLRRQRGIQPRLEGQLEGQCAVPGGNCKRSSIRKPCWY